MNQVKMILNLLFVLAIVPSSVGCNDNFKSWLNPKNSPDLQSQPIDKGVQKTEVIASKNSDLVNAWRAAYQQFNEASKRGDLKECERHLLTAYEFAVQLEQEGEHYPIAETSLFLAAHYTDNGPHDKAERHLAAGLKKCEDYNLDPLLYTRGLALSGLLLQLQGKYSTATQMLQRSLTNLENGNFNDDLSTTAVYVEVLNALVACQTQLKDADGLCVTLEKLLQSHLERDEDPNLVAHTMAMLKMSSQLNGDSETAGAVADALKELSDSGLVTDRQVLEMVDRALNQDGPKEPEIAFANQQRNGPNLTRSTNNIVKALNIENRNLASLAQPHWNAEQRAFFDEMTSIQVEYQICQARDAAQDAANKAKNKFLRKTGPTFSASTGIPYFYVASPPEHSFHDQIEMARLEKLFDLARQKFVNASR